jgi:hypothetical protein
VHLFAVSDLVVSVSSRKALLPYCQFS